MELYIPMKTSDTYSNTVDVIFACFALFANASNLQSKHGQSQDKCGLAIMACNVHFDEFSWLYSAFLTFWMVRITNNSAGFVRYDSTTLYEGVVSRREPFLWGCSNQIKIIR